MKTESTPTPAPEQPLKLRGTATVWKDNRWEFTPQGVGEPQQKGVRRVRQSRLFQTTSKTSPRTVLHLSVPADATDVVAELKEDFRQLTQGMEALPPQEPEAGKMLFNEQGVTVYYDRTEDRLAVRFTMKNEHQQKMQRNLLQIFQKLTTCLAINATFLAQPNK